MGLYKYSHKTADEKQVARAQLHDLNASYKDLSQVLAAITKKTIKQAEEILQDAIAKKMPIHYRKFAKNLGHRSELGGKKGRYPVKEAKFALQLLKNAIANANSKGLNRDNLYVAAVAAHKQNQLMRYRKYWASGIIIGYGKQSFASKYVTCWAEITLAEKLNTAGKTEKKPAANAKTKTTKETKTVKPKPIAKEAVHAEKQKVEEKTEEIKRG